MCSESFDPTGESLATGDVSQRSEINLAAGDWVRITGSKLSGQQFHVTSSAIEGDQHLHEATVDLDSIESRNSFVQATMDALGFPEELEMEVREALESALEQLAALRPGSRMRLTFDGGDDVPGVLGRG